ncbi:hypothetical protein OQZ33_19480 [Pedobacter sp. MC2016-05]|uniref:hypothetical protein n=1 Tax=Pedobacter sp. MC2016-05 TaxID=2994474 RepID=UPI00224759AD|nr:hypothetical protein [Pedobacter sp. MC2016-05]MCX2476524.1 hypothetical protein [Pedobacter sp. MC2016-05]
MKKQMNDENEQTPEQDKELAEEPDYRGIAGSGSLNSTKKKLHLDDIEDEPSQDQENPLTRGI